MQFCTVHTNKRTWVSRKRLVSSKAHVRAKEKAVCATYVKAINKLFYDYWLKNGKGPKSLETTLLHGYFCKCLPTDENPLTFFEKRNGFTFRSLHGNTRRKRNLGLRI